jgi:hypothetical protein
MFPECRRSLFLLLTVVALMFTFSAAAQDCSQCDPYANHCSDSCDKCTHQGIDGCDAWTESTCGAVGSGGTHGRCLADNCNPSWSETSRVTQGTYGIGEFWTCSHHAVQWVTITDANQCNLNSDYWQQHYCDDVIDGHKGWWYFPDCCDGTDNDHNPSSLFTCNHYHSCTG